MWILFVAKSSFIVPVTDEDDQGQTVPELVRTGGGLGRIGSGHLVQEPVRGRAKALLVLLTVICHRIKYTAASSVDSKNCCQISTFLHFMFSFTLFEIKYFEKTI